MSSNNYKPRTIKEMNEKINIVSKTLKEDEDELEKIQRKIGVEKNSSNRIKLEKQVAKIRRKMTEDRGKLKKATKQKNLFERRTKNEIEWAGKKNIEKLEVSNMKRHESSLAQEAAYDLKGNTLYVHKGLIKCIRDKHDIECVNACFMTASEENAIFNVNYCKTCNLYFVSEEEYLFYLKKFKTIIAKIKSYSENENNGIEGLASCSQLLLCGYSVSAETALSEFERERLLIKIISNNIMKKNEVIRMLDWLIRVNGQKQSNAVAKRKWEHDLEFVRRFNMEDQGNCRITKISPYKEYGKKR